mmetsp:Transcript_71343/g.190163  ORF Transcript_71343/g.190163 Transcript_71343/m.190163 type:complete len:202 (+) Transcript_71343:2403-3008(+)
MTHSRAKAPAAISSDSFRASRASAGTAPNRRKVSVCPRKTHSPRAFFNASTRASTVLVSEHASSNTLSGSSASVAESTPLSTATLRRCASTVKSLVAGCNLTRIMASLRASPHRPSCSNASARRYMGLTADGSIARLAAASSQASCHLASFRKAKLRLDNNTALSGASATATPAEYSSTAASKSPAARRRLPASFLSMAKT